jgi:hypothetical protein
MLKITQLPEILQQFLTQTADELAVATGFIRRQRAVTGAKFAQTLILGWLGRPQASRRQLHQSGYQAGLAVSCQALDQRFGTSSVRFMAALAQVGLGLCLEAEGTVGFFQRFKGVYIRDGSTVARGQGNCKLGVQVEWQRGQLAVSLEAPTCADQVLPLTQQALPSGALVLQDLGFFKLQRFADWNDHGIYWLTRYKHNLHLTTPDGQAFDLVSFLQNAPATVSCPIIFGKTPAVAGYLIAQRVTPEVYQQRLGAWKDLARRRQRPTPDRHLVLGHGTIYLTNIPDLTFDQAHILARTRWQIELLFKRWKSQLGLGRSRSADPNRQTTEFYAKLLAALISHWVLLTTAWTTHALSYTLALDIIQSYAHPLLAALANTEALRTLLHQMTDLILATARQSKRACDPRAHQLWDSFDHALP